jgi:2-polyprenyl-3-methyl-5-hydroxy-6-metoxy-1,4-benzoquinol methylase
MDLSNPIAPCPVCRSQDHYVWYPAQVAGAADVSFSYTFSPKHSLTFQIVRCRTCTHAYSSPIPEDIARHYKDVVDEEYLRHEPSRKLAAAAVLDRVAERRPAGRLLDVGCATGDLLVVARERGYDAEGLELSSWSAEIATQRGFTIHRERLEAMARRAPGSYDVITLMGVIEHFSEPLLELARLRALLRPGGVLVLWTGDVDSVTSRVLGRKWWYWQGQHIQYFTQRSLRLLIGSAGLVQTQVRTYPFGASYETLQNSLRRYRAHALLSQLIRPAFALKPTWKLYVPGEMLLLAEAPGT